ncbi:hydrolase 76 protein [Elasticomyces elasticus]|nr:hydrolase 76 protein [Elasticomyces elasticus]KAK3653017.1 hydrolase 76 protein [Elasticomyces elasticus]KAK4919585.1 hydrolase 76 protein [Elasticomyces elasticus]KAK5763125.1 hydrolase 76 protein [Elasticomyces elasticus]
MQNFLLATIALSAHHAWAVEIDLSNVTSINAAAKTAVEHVLAIYGVGNQSVSIPGIFPDPYYWWEGGLAWDSMVRYWALTGDDTYNDLVHEALLWQTGDDFDYMPPNQTKTLGNDDQSTWALAAMTAAEYGFPSPPDVTWVQLAQNVFDTQIARWDAETCGGGLRWQIFTFNTGYNYKNSISNGNLVQLAARLALYTGNMTNSDWAQKAVEWSQDLGLISEQGQVFDGSSTNTNCSTLNHLQWTSGATYLSGAVYAANLDRLTSADTWQSLVRTLVAGSDVFTSNDILYEVSCEPSHNCNVDQLAFKAILVRALANARDLTFDHQITASHNESTPISTNGSAVASGSLHDSINAILRTSARAAAASCSGGADGTTCGSMWTDATWDGSNGLGQELSALEVFLANLPAKVLMNANSTTGSPTTSGNGTATTGENGSSTSGSAVINTNDAVVNGKGSTLALVCGLGMAVALLL